MDPTPLASEPSPEAAPPSTTVVLSGWRLYGAWALLAVLLLPRIALNLWAAPLWVETQFKVDTPFQAVHVNTDWSRGAALVPQRGGIAEQAGMPEGRLVAIDGTPLVTGATIPQVASLLAGRIGEPVTLSVRTADADTVVSTLVRTDTFSPEMAGGRTRWLVGLIWAMELLAGLLWAAVGALLVVRQPRRLIALVGAWTMINYGGELLPFMYGVINTSVFSPLGFYIFIAYIIVHPIGMILFLSLFPDGRLYPRWTALLPLLYILSLTLIFFRLGQFNSFVLFGLSGVGIASQWVRYRRVATAEQRQQTKWAFLGISLSFAFVLTDFLLSQYLPELPGTLGYWWPKLIHAGLILGGGVFPIGVALSLLRYRLWDAEAAWSRSAMAAALVLALTAIIAGGTALTQAALGASGPLALGLGTAAAAVFFVPLQRRLSDWADHRFLRDLTNLRERLPDLVNHLRETESIEGIAEAVTDRVAPVVRATHVALVVPKGEGWAAVGVEGINASSATQWAQTAELERPPHLKGTRRQPWRSVVWRQPEDRLFPVRVALRAERGGGELATEGWLVLGPRPDGSGYGPDDLEAVAEIAGPVGRALQVVRVREARDADRDEGLVALGESLRETLADAIDRLRTDLHDLRTTPSR